MYGHLKFYLQHKVDSQGLGFADSFFDGQHKEADLESGNTEVFHVVLPTVATAAIGMKPLARELKKRISSAAVRGNVTKCQAPLTE